MSKLKKEEISAKGFSIQVYTKDFKNDYLSLTDIAKYKNTDEPRFVIQNWMRNRNTLEFFLTIRNLTVCNSTPLETSQD